MTRKISAMQLSNFYDLEGDFVRPVVDFATLVAHQLAAPDADLSEDEFFYRAVEYIDGYTSYTEDDGILDDIVEIFYVEV